MAPKTATKRTPKTNPIDTSRGRRTVQVSRCPECSAWVLAGLDDDFCAIWVRCDIEPLTWPGELAARFSGRQTCAIWQRRLTRRNRFQLRRPSEYPVLLIHQCEFHIPDKWKLPPPPIPKKTRSNIPPF